MELTARQKSLIRLALIMARERNMLQILKNDMEAYRENEEITEILEALYKCVTVKVVLE